MDHLEKIEETNYSGLTQKDDLIIHSIPKRFINSKQVSGKSHKGMGLLILGFGFIVLFAGALVAYVYVFKGSIPGFDFLLAGTAEPLAPLGGGDERPAAVPAVKNLSAEDAAKSGQLSEAEVAATSSETEADRFEPVDSTSPASSTETAATSSQIKTIEAEDVAETPMFMPPLDSDQDGLFDREEAVLGTNSNLADSDGDSYGDLSELKNKFNPAGPGKIETNASIEKYTNSQFSYSFYYPKLWPIETAAGNEALVIRIDENQFFQIIVATALNGLSLEEWYRAEMGIPAAPLKYAYKTGWYGIMSEDSSLVYLNSPGNPSVFALTYSVNQGTARAYQNLFDLMVESFRLDE